MRALVDALVEAGNATTSDGFQINRGGADCLMRGRALLLEALPVLEDQHAYPLPVVEAEEWFTDDDDAREVFRRGELVHRSPQPWTPAVADLLLYLESVGYGAAPRHRGYDDAGRELLTFLPGEDGPISWGYLHSDEGLASVARLLRTYHDAVREYRPPPHTVWADHTGAPADGEVLCHGDFAPWNLVWQNEEAVGIFDWDFVRPAEPMFDVYYAMDWTVPFRDDQTCREFHHFEATPDRAHRVGVFLDAYGVDVAPPERRLARSPTYAGASR